jgi:hypothetical protein
VRRDVPDHEGWVECDGIESGTLVASDSNVYGSLFMSVEFQMALASQEVVYFETFL